MEQLCESRFCKKAFNCGSVAENQSKIFLRFKADGPRYISYLGNGRFA